VCIQRSNELIVVLDLVNKREQNVETKSPTLRGGVVWIGDPTLGLAFVTRDGLDVYAASQNQWTLVNATRLSSGVKCFWTLPANKLVLLSTGDDGREMRAYGLLIPKHPSKFAKFSLQQAPAQGDVALVEMYGEAWAVHVRPSALDVYRIDQTASQLVRTVRFASPRGTCAISALDSLLVVHSTSQKVSLVYDLRDHGSRDDVAIAHPLPLGGRSANGGGGSGGDDDDAAGPADAYGASVVFLPPFWVLDAKQGRVWRLQLDLGACADCFTDTLEVGRMSGFLLRRRCALPRHVRPPPAASAGDDPATYGKAVLLSRVAVAIARDELRLADVELWFRASHEAMRRPERPPLPRAAVPYLVECRGENGVSLVLPSEVYRCVVAPVASEAGGRRAGWLAGLLLEYQRSLRMFGIALDAEVFETTALLLHRAGRAGEVFQLAQHGGVVADSSALASALLSEGGSASRQVAIDVLTRLGDWRALLRALVASLQLRRACELAVHMHKLLEEDEGALLVNAACNEGVGAVWMVAAALQQARPLALQGPPPSLVAQAMAMQLPDIADATPEEQRAARVLLGFE